MTSTLATGETTRRAVSSESYELLNFVLVRAPLLPIEFYLSLTSADGPIPVPVQRDSLLPTDPLIRRALAVGSLTLFDALSESSPSDSKANHHIGSLLRYLIRMSTRPTPYGMFAGVALGSWGATTTFGLSSSPPRTRTRPDMEWLYRIVSEVEARPAVRNNLSFVANSCAFVQGGRVWLPEKANGAAGVPISVRATRMVERALEAARSPITHSDLFEQLRELAPEAPHEKIEKLINDLRAETILLTDLHPPLTTCEPARYVAKRLAAIPAAQDQLDEVNTMLESSAKWDELHDEDAATAYATMARVANATGNPAVQVDMALQTSGRELNVAVGREAVSAAELLLKLSPLPAGVSYWSSYRNAFLSRYGADREVPLLELLDTNFGLGLPFYYTSPVALAPRKAADRANTLMNLGLEALHSHERTVELDDATIDRLRTSPALSKSLPLSLDLYVFLAATSARAIDRGEFRLIIGPNLGAMAAGRNLGRFADLLGPEASNALSVVAREEQQRLPGRIWAEMVYEPRQPHAANVVLRPAIRSHEIVVGATAGVDREHVIPVNELTVSMRQDRFTLHWTESGEEVVVCASHMLNNFRAPAIVRFLAELTHEAQTSLSGFDWGPASSLPFLPRVCKGRIVLRAAEWRIDSLVRDRDLGSGKRASFSDALARWRRKWNVPRHIYVSAGDNRLLLDLEDHWQVEELRSEVSRLQPGGVLSIQEVLPDFSEHWLHGTAGHFVTELVVSLIRKPGHARMRDVIGIRSHAQKASPSFQADLSVRLRLPGSDWLFVKLYGLRELQDNLIAGPVLEFAEKACASGSAESWFYVRYSDPDPHLRLRFHGAAERLTKELMPSICHWASNLMRSGSCLRFAFDSYDREIERYGGALAITAAESVFAADSKAAAGILALFERKILRLEPFLITLVSIDELLGDLGLDELQRLNWYDALVISKKETSEEYRRLKNLLRVYLGDPNYRFAQLGGARLDQIFKARRSAIQSLSTRLRDLDTHHELTQSLATVFRSFVHLHLNRLVSADAQTESRMLALLLRTRESLRHLPVVSPYQVFTQSNS